MSFRTKHLRVLIAVFACLLSLPGFAASMSDSVILYTPYTKIAVTPGQSVTYVIDLINNSKEVINADISLKGLPASWNYNLKAGNYNIQKVSVLAGEKKSLNLSLEVPFKVNKGSYRFRIVAGDFYELPLTIVVSEQGTFETEFTSDQANMEGSATSIFTYQAMLRNGTAGDQLYALMADAPRGWNVTFKYLSRQVTSVEVKENSNTTVNIEIDPPDMTEAGIYKIPVHASTNSTSSVIELEVVITGSYAIELTTPTGLLSTNITAGDQKSIELIVKNTGSVQLSDVKLSAINPISWAVTFDPKKVDIIKPGESVKVIALIKAARKALAGDYVINIDAKTQEATSKAQFRISVRTSILWGWVGILIICSALGGVYYLFRKYGRR